MGRILVLFKYELLGQSVYPYAFLAMLIVFSATYSTDFNKGGVLVDMEISTGGMSYQALEKAVLTGYLLNLKSLYIQFTYGIFSPWMILGISAAYAFSICRDLKRERLRYMLSLPVERTEYVLVKIVVVTLLVLASYYLSMLLVLGLRFGFRGLAYTFPLVYLRDIMLVSSISVLVAVATKNDLVTIFSGLMGKTLTDFTFSNYFVGRDGYDLIFDIEPFHTLGLIDTAQKVSSDLLRRFLLPEAQLIDQAITYSNLYTMYAILASLLFITLSLAIFRRTEVD